MPIPYIDVVLPSCYGKDADDAMEHEIELDMEWLAVLCTDVLEPGRGTPVTAD